MDSYKLKMELKKRCYLENHKDYAQNAWEILYIFLDNRMPHNVQEYLPYEYIYLYIYAYIIVDVLNNVIILVQTDVLLPSNVKNIECLMFPFYAKKDNTFVNIARCTTDPTFL